MLRYGRPGRRDAWRIEKLHGRGDIENGDQVSLKSMAEDFYMHDNGAEGGPMKGDRRCDDRHCWIVECQRSKVSYGSVILLRCMSIERYL